ncbi:hypothetical protein C2869_16530 [Saccharobesus litoralis]|uniref:YcgL domain-containing protein C2869_16530 n=1 Tax=Saccharobesus litoralis TaxID=2172099 RepID=A0A2S0VV02_9ALTE|nr:YcgL domain-containing protein [Saccharobesus litoralis]AWB67930.1 hypothetical protein C2869_16530 [Saccharobesus litoralis]
MLSAVYKSNKKPDTYLFVEQRDNFDKVPESLLTMFGTPELVTIVNLASRSKLAISDIEKVKQELKDKGYFVQLPPPQEDLLKEHKARLKAQGKLNEDN